MLRSCFRPFERYLLAGRSVADRGDGLLWHKDLKPHSSGDFSIAAVQANSFLEDQGQVVNSPFGTYVGVYDGHGGPEASRFLNKHLFPHMEKFALEQGGMSVEVLEKAFNAIEEEFLHLVKRAWPTQPQIASVGSCCLVGAISNNMLYVANLGDSRAVLGSSCRTKKSVTAERLSTEHNVALEDVRKELKALHPDDAHIVVLRQGVWRVKGIIQVLRIAPSTSLEGAKMWVSDWSSCCTFAGLVVYFGNLAYPVAKQTMNIFPKGRSKAISCFDFPHIFVYFINLREKAKAGCALSLDTVSRSIGDIYLKQPEFNRDPLFAQFGYPVPLQRPVMTAKPSILVRQLKPQDLFLIFASDGLWEQLSDKEAVEIVHSNPRAGIAKRLVRAALQEAAKKREMRYSDLKKIERGVRRHFHDDITVIVIFLDHELINKQSKPPLKHRRGVDYTSVPVDIFSSDGMEMDDSS